MAVIARLFGLEPPPAASCRVLELGCGSASNLASIALTLPGATCVGLDNAEQAIARGRQRVSELGLTNLTLEVQSILDVDDALGRFDYIICHGVYSWVPREVQDKILEIFARNLADNGVAYVSFNTYPGWRLRGMVREMMLYHVRPFAQPAQRAEQARAVADLLARFSPSRSDAYRAILSEEARDIQSTEDWYLLHDQLAAVNTPLYFHEFVERAHTAGLQYLGPAQFVPWEARLPEQLARILDRLPDRIRREQYLDFLSGRMFRRSLFCREGLPLRAAPSAEAVGSFVVSARSRPARPVPDTASDAVEKFETPWGGELSTNHALTKTALARLAELWPRATTFSDLWTDVSRRLPPQSAAGDTAEDLADVLLLCFQAAFVDLFLQPPPCALEPGERPVASLLARLQARDHEIVTNLKHQHIEVDALPRFLLRHCDGTRDRAELLDLIIAETERGELELRRSDETLVTDRDMIREAARTNLEAGLRKLANHALLTA